MVIVHEYCSFFDYEILKDIIDHFGGNTIRQQLAVYSKEFAGYANRRVYDDSCPSEVGRISKAGRLFVPLDKAYNNYTISSLKLLSLS